MDPVSALFIFSGVIVLAASWIQLIITASREDFTWGLFALFYHRWLIFMLYGNGIKRVMRLRWLLLVLCFLV